MVEKIAKEWVSDSMGGSASKALGKELIGAASTGDTARVQTLLAAKAPVDQSVNGFTSLALALVSAEDLECSVVEIDEVV